MKFLISSRAVRDALLASAMSLLVSSAALAQGAAGGSLGNDNKSLSGAGEERRSAAPARRERSERKAAPRRETASRRSSGGGGGGNFDGVWTVTASPGCAASGTANVLISGRTVAGQGVSGSVSASGAIRTVGNAGGISVVSTGQITGRTGSGSYRQSDGCSGTLRAIKN